MTTSPATPVPDSTPIPTDAAVPVEAAVSVETAGPAETAVPVDVAVPVETAGDPVLGTPEQDATASARAVGAAASLDHGTFTSIVQPRSPHRLELEHGVWHQISRKYLWVQLISSAFGFVLVLAAVIVLSVVLQQTWVLIPGAIVIVILIWTMAILPRQARSIGYQLRDDDLVFRRGILWQRMVAVPYGRMQLVDITHGPLDRGFGIAQLKFVTAAATTGVTIPGLEQAAAETLRDHLIGVAESRRTGL